MKSLITAAALFGALVRALPVDHSVELTLHRRELYGDTSDELDLCRPVTLIFARGTVEPGNVGLLAGPPFFDALSDIIGSDNLAVQGVPYSASILGYLEQGDPAGSQTFAQLTTLAARTCPDTQLVLAGYSQGAQLVHNGASQIDDVAILARVRAVVLFGDPFDGRAFPAGIADGVVRTFCFALDLICEDTVVVDPAHLSYSVDAVPAAAFVAGKVDV